MDRLINDRQTGQTMFLAFRYDSHDGTLIGDIDDPQTAHWDGSRLCLSPVAIELSK